MLHVEREFNFGDARRISSSGYRRFLFFSLLALLCHSGAVHGQWRRVQTFASPYQIPNDRFNQVASVRFVKFNQWGIGFAGISPSPQNPEGGVWRSTDSGQSWNESHIKVDSQFQNQIHTDDITFKDSLTGWFCTMATLDPPIGGGSVFETTDGGSNWFSIFSDATFEPRAIYYCPLNGRLFASLWVGGGPIISTDEGKTWVYAVQTPGSNGFAACDSVILITAGTVGTAGQQLRSTDAGITWVQSYSRTVYPLGVESWQPYADTVRKLFYQEQDATDGEPSDGFYQSSDSGFSWRAVSYFASYFTADGTSEFGGPNGCIAGDAAGNLYIQKIADGEGVFVSSDSGNTWTSICGPSNKWDTRFCVFNNTLFAGGYIDDSEGIWALSLNEPREILLDTATAILGSKCNAVNKPFYFGSTFPCPNSVTLDSVTVNGSPAFTAQSDSNQQVGINGLDSIMVHYQAQTPYDTAALIFHFVENGIAHDSAVTIYGVAAAPVDVSLYLKPTTITAHAGDTIDIPIYISGNGTLSGMTSATIPLVLDMQTLTPVGFFPSAGFLLSAPISYSNGIESIQLQGQNITLAGETLVGNLQCIVYLSDTLTAQVSLSPTTVNSDDPRCLSLSTSTDAVDITLTGCGDSTILAVMHHEPLFSIQSIVPNPAQNEIRVSGTGLSNVAMELYDVLGNLTTPRPLLEKEGEITLDVSPLPPGIYYLRFSSEGYVETRSISIQR